MLFLLRFSQKILLPARARDLALDLRDVASLGDDSALGTDRTIGLSTLHVLTSPVASADALELAAVFRPDPAGSARVFHVRVE